MNKILSFIVPSYNCEKFLRKCIESFLCYEVSDDIEVIIVNDGSSDRTAEIAKEYCDKCNGVVKLINQENKGHGGALNTGLKAATGKYLKVIDADDWVELEALPLLVDTLKGIDSDVVLCHHYTIDITSGEKLKWKTYPEKFGVAYNLSHIMDNWKSFDRSLTFHGIIYRNDFYKENSIELSEHVFYEDYEYATIPCCYAKSITPLDMFLYNYRVGDVEQSVSDENQLKRVSHTETVLCRLIDEYKKSDNMEEQGRRYYAMKTKSLLLSYMTTVMLVEKNKKKGRQMGEAIMGRFRKEFPEVCSLSEKQYKIFRLMNRLHISKRTWEKISHSSLYNKLRKNHSFS